MTSKHRLNGLFHLAAKISKLLFDRHCSILIFIGDNYPDDIVGNSCQQYLIIMAFQLVLLNLSRALLARHPS